MAEGDDSPKGRPGVDCNFGFNRVLGALSHEVLNKLSLAARISSARMTDNRLIIDFPTLLIDGDTIVSLIAGMGHDIGSVSMLGDIK